MKKLLFLSLILAAGSTTRAAELAPAVDGRLAPWEVALHLAVQETVDAADVPQLEDSSGDVALLDISDCWNVCSLRFSLCSMNCSTNQCHNACAQAWARCVQGCH